VGDVLFVESKYNKPCNFIRFNITENIKGVCCFCTIGITVVCNSHIQNIILIVVIKKWLSFLAHKCLVQYTNLFLLLPSLPSWLVNQLHFQN